MMLKSTAVRMRFVLTRTGPCPAPLHQPLEDSLASATEPSDLLVVNRYAFADGSRYRETLANEFAYTRRICRHIRHPGRRRKTIEGIRIVNNIGATACQIWRWHRAGDFKTRRPPLNIRVFFRATSTS